MFLDALNQYSAAQALSATGASTNVIDHSLDRDLGIGEPLTVLIAVPVALAGTAPTFQATVQSDSSSGFGSAVTVGQSKQYSALPAGSIVAIPLPADTSVDRYTRVNYTLGGTTPTITVSAYLIPTKHVQAWAARAGAFLVD